MLSNSFGSFSNGTSVFEKDIKRICSKLKTIGNVQFGEKWNSQTQRAENDTTWTAAKRTFWNWNEGRKQAVEDFKTTFEEANLWCGEILNKYDSSTANERDLLVELLCELTDMMNHAKFGLVRQKGQYRKDESAKSDLDEVITNVNNYLKHIKSRVLKQRIAKKPVNDPEFRGYLHAVVPTGPFGAEVSHDPLRDVDGSQIVQRPRPMRASSAPIDINDESDDDSSDTQFSMEQDFKPVVEEVPPPSRPAPAPPAEASDRIEISVDESDFNMDFPADESSNNEVF